jgi:hypothetical protein
VQVGHVDEALFTTWEQLVGDLRRLLRDEEALDVAEIAKLGRHDWEDPPGGFIRVGRLFDAPGDVVIDLNTIDGNLDRRERAERSLADLLGDKYARAFKASPLVARLARMKAEMDRGDEPFARKLRYLFWMN